VPPTRLKAPATERERARAKPHRDRAELRAAARGRDARAPRRRGLRTRLVARVSVRVRHSARPSSRRLRRRRRPSRHRAEPGRRELGPRRPGRQVRPRTPARALILEPKPTSGHVQLPTHSVKHGRKVRIASSARPERRLSHAAGHGSGGNREPPDLQAR
jgi:hypothetical protein